MANAVDVRKLIKPKVVKTTTRVCTIRTTSKIYVLFVMIDRLEFMTRGQSLMKKK